MMKYMVVLLMAGLVCGCDKTTSTDVKSGDKSFIPMARPATPAGEKSFKQPAKVTAPKAAPDKMAALVTSKTNVEKAKTVWQADPKNAAKRQAYDDAVADCMGKTAAATQGK